MNYGKVVRAGRRKLQGYSFFLKPLCACRVTFDSKTMTLLLAHAKFKLHILKRKSLQRILINSLLYLAQTCDRLARVGKTSVLHNVLYILKICAYFGRKSICRYDKGRFPCILQDTMLKVCT